MDTKKVVTNETSNDLKREKIRVIPIQFFDDFPKHPFNVKMDEEMEALIESIKEFGILTPLVARKKGNERYEIIAGHRRKFAAEKLGFTELPVILREMTKDEAVIAMVKRKFIFDCILWLISMFLSLNAIPFTKKMNVKR